MSTTPDIRSMRRIQLSHKAITIAIVAALALLAALAGWRLYDKLTTTTVVAYFPEALALYPGDKVTIMGARVGSVDKIEPDGDKMRVTLRYASKYQLPANATASIVNPSLVASRTVQLSPAYTGGPTLADNAVIPIDRTQVPVEWDDLRNQITKLVTQLGPTPDQPQGPFGELISSFAVGLDGKGQQINTTLNSLSDALTALNQGRGDFFGVVKSLALFVNALHSSDQQFVALNNDLAQFTNSFTHNDQELATAVREIDGLLTTVRKFVDDNGSVLSKDVNNLADVTSAILQPDPRNGLETGLHVLPNTLANAANTYEPAHGAATTIPAIANFAHPLQFLCSSIQAGSRLGYQDSAELCAQYLTPILDAVKFNHLPFGMNLLSTAATLPKHIAYSEPRLQPPPGYKDTTVPGIWSRDTLFSHGNHEPGWVVAPGMQGVQVQAFTQAMLTPESLAELLGGRDIDPPGPAGPRGGAAPNAYDQNNPLPPPWYPQPLPTPAPAPVDAPLGAAEAPGPVR